MSEPSEAAKAALAKIAKQRLNARHGKYAPELIWPPEGPEREALLDRLEREMEESTG